MTLTSVLRGRMMPDVGEVYVVTEGCYSDYHIVAVFSDRALAEEFAGAPDDVEEWRLWDGPIPYVDVLRLHAKITDRGRIIEDEPREWKHYPDLGNEWTHRPGLCETDEPYLWDRRPPYSFTFQVEGTDIERVRKVYSEKRAEYLANYAVIIERLTKPPSIARGDRFPMLHPASMPEDWRESYDEAFDKMWDEVVGSQPPPD